MRCRAALTAVALAALVFPAAAGAATLSVHSLPMAGLLDGIGKVIFGGLEIGAKELGKLVLSLLAGIADMIVPDSWGKKGVEFVKWLAAIPDYTGKGFKDFHGMRRMTLGLALALLPVTMTWAGAAWMFGTERSEPLQAIVIRTLTVIVLLMSWGTVWKTVPALGNQLSNAFLSMPAVSEGLQKYMEVAVAGGLLGSIPFLGVLIWMLAAFLLVCGVGLKVFILLLGGILYFVGPLLLPLAPLAAGHRLIRRYISLFVAVPLLPLAFAIIFTAAALFIKGAGSIGTAIGGSSVFGSAAGGIIAGFAAILGPLVCFGVAKRMLGPGLDSLKGSVSNFSPAATLGRARAGVAAARAGVSGRGAGQTRTTTHSMDGGPQGAMRRLAESRVGVRQAIQVGAGFAGLGSRPATPARTALKAAQVAARGGIPAIGGMAAGAATAAASTHLAGRGGIKGVARDAATRLREPGAKPDGTAAAHEAALHSLRPQGFRGPQNAPVEPPKNGRKPPARSTADSPAARLPGTAPEPLRPAERAALSGAANNGQSKPSTTTTPRPDRTRGPVTSPDSTVHLPAGGVHRRSPDQRPDPRPKTPPVSRPSSNAAEGSTPRPTPSRPSRPSEQRPDLRPRPVQPDNA